MNKVLGVLVLASYILGFLLLFLVYFFLPLSTVGEMKAS